MKKNITSVFAILLLQLIAGWFCLHFDLLLTEGRSPLLPFPEISNLWFIGLAVMIVVPIVGGKLLFDTLRRPITWQQSLVIYSSLISAEILLTILWLVLFSGRF